MAELEQGRLLLVGQGPTLRADQDLETGIDRVCPFPNNTGAV